MSYCTADDAKSAGARGSIAEIAAAIAVAEERVNLYTGDVFEPTVLTIECDVDGDGYAYTRRRIVEIDSVSWLNVVTPIDPAGYRVSSSAVPGGRDRVELYGALGWSDITVLGAEPWNGGWVGYASRYGEPRVTVVGTFGWETVPSTVAHATALIAAMLRGSDADAEDPSVQVDVEGNVLPVVESVKRPELGTAAERESTTVRDRTTGSAAADELLAPYVREPVRMR